jgi:uncharacterized membrane protein
MTKESLIQLLAQQIKYATGLDGKIGIEAANERKLACDAANCTLAILSQMGLAAEDAFEQAEALIA